MPLPQIEHGALLILAVSDPPSQDDEPLVASCF
jgi:hypothetical protein